MGISEKEEAKFSGEVLNSIRRQTEMMKNLAAAETHASTRIAMSDTYRMLIQASIPSQGTVL
jgi:hypothetical protein